MKDEKLYISMEPEEFRNGNSFLLNTQIALLSLIKQLYKIQKLRNKKNKLKSELNNIIENLNNDFDKIDEKLPEMPKHKIIKETYQEIPKETHTKNFIFTEEDRRMAGVDEELQEIQDKLKKLNG